MSDPLDLEALRKLVEAATPVKWWSPVCAPFAGTWQPGQILDHAARPLTSKEDAVLACEAAKALPALLDEVERLREVLRRLADAVQPLEDRHDEASIACPAPREGAPGCSVCGLIGPLTAARRALGEETGP